MPRIIECVPNFSEGRNKDVIESIANAIAHTDGCNLLDVDPGISTNRTVYTFVGSPEAVIEGAMHAARAAYQLIDMRNHHGEHPRMGAMDVCPFIPVQNATMDDCVKIAKDFAERLSIELGVSVYLYGEAAVDEKRRALPNIRAGEYEGLQEKLQDPEWKPDFGPAELNASWGATAVGARKFLIAYNVNLLGTKEQAHHIALKIRESGPESVIIVSDWSKLLLACTSVGYLKPFQLPKLQAIGWYLEEANLAQVSMNLTDFEVTGLHTAYEACMKKAEELNLATVGSQIVGIVPLKALMDAADYYLKKDNLFILEEDQKLRLVISRLGLNSLGAFSPKERIIEYMVQSEHDGPLATMDLKDFVLTVGSRSPSPGGGSVAALCASLGAALSSMVGFMTYGNRKFHKLDGKMRELIPPLYKAMKDLIPFVDADAAAFSEYMLACKLPHDTEAESQLRQQAMESGLMTAVQVPLCVAKLVTALWPTLKELAVVGNINCRSDLQVGVRVLETGVWGAYYNVITNLKDIKNDVFIIQVRTEIEDALQKAQEGCSFVLKILEERKND